MIHGSRGRRIAILWLVIEKNHDLKKTKGISFEQLWFLARRGLVVCDWVLWDYYTVWFFEMTDPFSSFE